MPTAAAAADNPFRCRGYYYDNETGLYYLNARYYNPQWGRFINADSYGGSTGKLLSHNVFAYCSNNPVMMSDPSGNRETIGAGDPQQEDRLRKEEVKKARKIAYRVVKRIQAHLLGEYYETIDHLEDICNDGGEIFVHEISMDSYISMGRNGQKYKDDFGCDTVFVFTSRLWHDDLLTQNFFAYNSKTDKFAEISVGLGGEVVTEGTAGGYLFDQLEKWNDMGINGKIFDGFPSGFGL